MNHLISIIYSILPVFLKRELDRLNRSDIGNRIAKGAFWSLSGAVISRMLMLLASIVLARILGKTEYGELGMIRSTVNMFAVFAGFGLGLTATKYIAEFRECDKVKTGKIIGLSTLFAGLTGGVIALVVLLAAPFIAVKTINAPHLVNELRLGAFMLFFSALNGAQTGTLAGYEAFKAIAKVNLVSGLIAFPIQVGFTLLWGLTGSVVGFGTNFLVLWLLNFIAVRKESKRHNVKIDFYHVWNEWPVLYKFSLPALLSGILVSPVMWACSAMLVNQTNGYDEMAVFDAANQWKNAILFIPAVLAQIVLPLLSSSNNNQIQFNKILRINIGLNFMTSLFMAGIISLFSGSIMKSYGVDFAEGRWVLIILSFTTVLVAVNNVIGQAIAGKGKMWIGFLFNSFWSITLLFSTYIFFNHNFGAIGLALGLIISYSFHTIIQFYYLKIILKLR